MKLVLATVSPRRASGPAAELVSLYLERTQRYCTCAHVTFPTEVKLLESIASATARTRPVLLLTDSRGEQLTSEQLATTLGKFQDNGTQSLTLAIGPADGWSAAALDRAEKSIAFGRITLPHELAAAIAAEQIYRAFTILAGHPYHSGH